MSQCSKCGEEGKEFRPKRKICEDCGRASSRAWYHANKEKAREQAARFLERNPDYYKCPDRMLKAQVKRYNLTVEEYKDLERSQGGLCAICCGPPTGRGTLHIDHCHSTGKVRGLLCTQCNTGLGMMNDDLGLLRLATSYLERAYEPVP